MIPRQYFRKIALLCLLVLVIIPFPVVIAKPDQAVLTIHVKDSETKKPLDGALIYIDGGYVGITSSDSGGGSFLALNLSDGTHTLRATMSGYSEDNKKIQIPHEQSLELSLKKSFLVPLNPEKKTGEGLTIIFYPSSTSYDCTDKVKVRNPLYITNETRFREDVMMVINQTFMNMDEHIQPGQSLMAGYQDRFNFYYYFDPASPADAFESCAGTIPDSYWQQITFSDITVILYPTYYGLYANSECQPTGCYQNFGPGRSLMKVPADQPALIRHEAGHALFELVDTYCGSTYYYQNDPFPNVWSSSDACTTDATRNNRDPALCRQIKKNPAYSSVSCSKEFWQWDPMPDIMATGYSGRFGAAAVQRINHVITQSVRPS